MKHEREPGAERIFLLRRASELDLVRPRSSRFAQQPFGLRQFGAWEGRALPPNANAKRQAAARKARKATRRAG